MSKPPQSTPHSDIDGVHQDERRNTDVARETGEDAADLTRAHEESRANPPYADDKPAGPGGSGSA